jgi:phospholipid/cholesterol/gamma-HCH transport system substrate-binding protein
MDTTTERFRIRLGFFVAGGLLLLVAALFFIGRQRHLFSPVVPLYGYFRDVAGLEVGNGVRFSGIHVGSVEDLAIVNDSTVRVTLAVRREVLPHIKADSRLSIGTDGLVGDRIVHIAHGTAPWPDSPQHRVLPTVEPVETDAIMKSLQDAGKNVEAVTARLTQILSGLSEETGTLGMLINDSSLATSIESTIENLETGTERLNENMKAVRQHFLFRGYFKKKQKEAEKAREKAKEEEEEKNEKEAEEQEQKEKNGK